MMISLIKLIRTEMPEKVAENTGELEKILHANEKETLPPGKKK